MNRDALRLVMLASSALILGVAVYFWLTGNVALGAALFALGLMELTVALILTRRGS